MRAAYCLCFSYILRACQCAVGNLASSADTRYSMRLGNPHTFKTAKTHNHSLSDSLNNPWGDLQTANELNRFSCSFVKDRARRRFVFTGSWSGGAPAILADSHYMQESFGRHWPSLCNSFDSIQCLPVGPISFASTTPRPSSTG